MAIVFPKSELWPLPKDYETLTEEGQRLARVNACSLGGTPELEVASWHCFREWYLIPEALSWYKTDYSPSPQAHAQWVYDWAKYPLLVHVAPRGMCKTTINLEDIAKKMLTRPYWECVLFLSTIKFCGDRLGRLMDLVEHNPRIIQDFGKMKGRIWNRSTELHLSNGSKVSVFPIKGAALGSRPSGLIVLDDVEKSDDHVITPSDLRLMMKDFFFNAIYPMSQSPGKRIPIRIIGTLYNRRMFIYHLFSTEDPKISENWKRTLMTVYDMDWDVLKDGWIDEQKKILTESAFSSQYLNCPTTASSRMLDIHPELCTYWLENEDGDARKNPFDSRASIVTHQCAGWTKEQDSDEPIPVPRLLRRPWADIVRKMSRFITVDYAPTTTQDSDFSVVHVMGFENEDEHRDTLYSLDLWRGRARSEELLRIVYQMALRWRVPLIGVEAYPVLAEFYERVRDDLPGMFGQGETPPRVIPLKFPPKVDKASKLMGLEWRFVQFRVKLPLDLKERDPNTYGRLWYEIENTTEDLALLDYDDCVDSLAMHQAIGKPHRATGPDIAGPIDLNRMIQEGKLEDDITGIPYMSGLSSSNITDATLRALQEQRWEGLQEEYGEDFDEDLARDCDYMGLPEEFFRRN